MQLIDRIAGLTAEADILQCTAIGGKSCETDMSYSTNSLGQRNIEHCARERRTATNPFSVKKAKIDPAQVGGGNQPMFINSMPATLAQNPA